MTTKSPPKVKARKPLRPEHQGRIGEKLFQQWAGKENLVIGLPDPDTAGWDYTFQLPINPPIERAELDHRPSSVMCKLQVKTVSTDVRSVKIKLDNWEHMATELIPWFVLVVRLNHKKATAAYLIHIGREWIEAFYRRLHKAQGNPAKPLHKQAMAVSWTEEQRLPRLTGRSFVKSARLALGPGTLATYVTDKIELLRKIEGYSHTATITVSGRTTSDFEVMSDMGIGLIDSMPASKYEIRRTHYGVETVVAQETSGVTFSIPRIPSIGTSKITLSDTSYSAMASLPFETRVTAQVFRDIPSQFNKIRLTSGFLDIVIDPRTSMLKFHFNVQSEGSPRSLETLGRAGEFFLLLANHNERRIVMEVALSFVKESLTITGPEFDLTHDASRELMEFAEAAAGAWWLAKSFGLEDVSVHPESLHSQFTKIVFMKACLDGKRERTSISINVGNPDASCKAPVAFLFTPGIVLGEHVLLVSAALTGVPVREPGDGKRIRIESDGFRYLRKMRIKQSETSANKANHLKELVDASIELLAKQGITSVMHDSLNLGARRRKTKK